MNRFDEAAAFFNPLSKVRRVVVVHGWLVCLSLLFATDAV